MREESSNLLLTRTFFCDVTFKVNKDSQP